MTWAALLMALRAIRRNVLRSMLTTLGIVIGVGAVIAMVTLGEGATARVTGEIAALGDNLLIVVPGNGDQKHGGVRAAATPFDVGDAEAIAELSEVAAVAPLSASGVRVVRGSDNWATTLNGTTPEFLEVRRWPVVEGRMFNRSEERSGAPVCVLGATVREEVFGSQDPIGASVRLSNVSCQVIGVLEEKGQGTFGNDQDDLVLMPLTTFQRRVANSDDVATIFVSATTSSATPRVQARINDLMHERRHIRQGDEDDFAVRDMKEVTSIVESATGVLTALLGAIAAISLLVGGIGIMNIMLVSVTERTREIGIRLAIGARGREVLLQFLVEAIVLSLLGGLLGIALGLGASYGAARALDIPFVFLPEMVVVAFGFSAAVGVAFGFFPARKAARMNPIDALRRE
ncbi:MAG: ABC transporter permease [Sandaracinaceae bacterium]